jgi:hypothetical protein
MMHTALLTALVMWISGHFGLAPNYEHPDIKFLPAAEITALRYRAFTPSQQREVASALHESGGQPSRREAVAVYDDATKTIFLPDTWKGDNPADISVLIHELVHHLQNMARLRYECAGAREQVAYAAQEKWLNLVQRDLLSEFQIDRFTLKVSTACGY